MCLLIFTLLRLRETSAIVETGKLKFHVFMCLCVHFIRRSLHFLVRVSSFFSCCWEIYWVEISNRFIVVQGLETSNVGDIWIKIRNKVKTLIAEVKNLGILEINRNKSREIEFIFIYCDAFGLCTCVFPIYI